jgi:hypothetical protein
MELKIDLSDIEVGEWNDTISELLRSEITHAIQREVRKTLSSNDAIKKAVKKIQDAAANELLRQIEVK